MFLGLRLHNALAQLNCPEGHSYFTIDEEIKAADLINLYSPSFSTDEAEKQKEEDVVYNVHTFLKKVESKFLTNAIN